MYIFYGILIAVESRKNGTYKMSLWDKVLLLPSSFDVPSEDCIDLSISSMKEVTHLSQEVNYFCLSHGCNKRRAYHMSLAVEEMAGNIVLHGISHDNKKHSIEVRIIKKDENLILRIRDDCFIFDPVNQLDLFSNEDITHHLGLRLIIITAKEVRYTSILKLNNLLVRV